MYYIDDSGNSKLENISVCTHYLEQIVGYINQVWQEMSKEFQ